VTGPPRVQIGDVSIDAVTFQQALEIITDRAASRQGGTVFTPNVDHIVMARKNRAFREAYSRATLSLVDGTPVLWASRLLGHPLPEKISGSDLFLPLIEMAAKRGLRVFLLGGAAGVADLTATRLKERFPGLEIVGTGSPQVGATSDSLLPLTALETVRLSDPHLLFVAMGAPKQEFLIDRAAALIGPCVAVGVGAAFDFIAGRQRRAPPWISALGLEWAYRLWHEPRRLWRRYLLQDPAFFSIVVGDLVQRWRLRPAR
jgi:N-acetylglucosaminyldiphosphoundecaprenol N-acetyl-beta-D-mannosaminyltransferase